MAREYALGRFAFGRQIASFQAIKHKLADMYVGIELARSNAYYGAWALSKDAPELPRRRGGGAGGRERGLLPGGQGEHPGARRHGLHLGVRLPPPLPARQAHRPHAGQRPPLEGSARHPARSRRAPRRRIVDFDDTREEAAFRAEVRQWLGAHAEPKRGAFETWQSRYPGREGWDGLERAKAFQRSKAEAGFAALHWPAEWGGRALPPIYQVIYAQEESRFLVPRGYFEIGLGMCMPTLFAYATEEQKRRYAPAALRGDEVWCQLFSEPGAGSDLAGLRTRAAAGRRRLGDQRPEDLDLGRALGRLGHPGRAQRSQDGQAQGPHLLLPVHEVAGHRDAPDQADLGRVALQRGLLHRRAHPRHPAPGRGRRGLGRGHHHAHERAPHLRRPARPRLRGDLRPGPRHRSSRTAPPSPTRRCASAWPTST